MIRTELVLGFASALSAYLNTAVDPTGDGPLVPFVPARCLPFAAALFAHSAVTNNDAIAGITNAAGRAAWMSLSPVSFRLVTPPVPGGVKLASVAPLTPIASLSALYEQGTKDGFVEYLAGAVHTALTASVCAVTHTVPAPSGQAPGPPIILPVR